MSESSSWKRHAGSIFVADRFGYAPNDDGPHISLLDTATRMPWPSYLKAERPKDPRKARRLLRTPSPTNPVVNN